MKERFSSDEWRLLTLMPGMVLHMIILSDGKATDAETQYFSEEIAAPGATKNELHRELLVSFGENAEANFKDSLALMQEMGKAFAACNYVLEQNLTGKERQSFLASLMVSALLMAEADGIDRNEQEVFAAFASAFDVDPAAFDAEVAKYRQ